MTGIKRSRLLNKRQAHNRMKKMVDKKVKNEVAQGTKDPKGLLGCPTKNDNITFEQKKAELQSETQQYMYSQSSKFSSVSRNLIFGAMGTIWAFSFTNGEITINNVCLMIALLLSVLYLFLDVIHYYTDTNSYNKEQYNLDKYKNDEDLVKHEKTMDSINQRSNHFIVWKFRVLIVASLMFVIGFLYQTKLADSLIKYVAMLF